MEELNWRDLPISIQFAEPIKALNNIILYQRGVSLINWRVLKQFQEILRAERPLSLRVKNLEQVLHVFRIFHFELRGVHKKTDKLVSIQFFLSLQSGVHIPEKFGFLFDHIEEREQEQNGGRVNVFVMTSSSQIVE